LFHERTFPCTSGAFVELIIEEEVGVAKAYPIHKSVDPTTVQATILDEAIRKYPIISIMVPAKARYGIGTPQERTMKPYKKACWKHSQTAWQQDKVE